ncbi:MAG TPA: dTDP-4-dehydrorhamnose reductase [bacterium]
MANLKLHKERVMIFGANGLLGQKLVASFINRFEVWGAGREGKAAVDFAEFRYSECDIVDRVKIRNVIRETKPQLIVNAAAYTDVDGCEDHKEECWNVNVKGVENLAQAARSNDAWLIHVSTDYLFDGREGVSYAEVAKPNPLSYYGRSKLAGENAILTSGVEHTIVRTMILYGSGRGLRLNFATWLVDRLSQGEAVKIVDDQFGHPTLVDDLAQAIRRIVELKKTGVYHVCGAEYLNRYDFAVKLAHIFGFDVGLIQRAKTSDLKQKAVRPLRSRFDLTKTIRELGIELCGVEEGLKILKQQLQSAKA